MSRLTFDTRLLPLRDRRGCVKSLVLVDAEDFPRLARCRWYRHSGGYAARGKSTLMHREILGLAPRDEGEVDHANGDRLDNRKCNLRVRSGFASEAEAAAAARAFRGEA